MPKVRLLKTGSVHVLTFIRFLINNGIYYSINSVILCGGDSGSRMYFDEGRYPPWQCNGRIIDRVTCEKCCDGKETTAKKNSFFEGRKLNEAEVMRFVYGRS